MAGVLWASDGRSGGGSGGGANTEGGATDTVAAGSMTGSIGIAWFFY